MNYEFDRIVLRYEGLDADRGELELAHFAQSIHGASRLIGSAANIIVTGQFVKKVPALSVRIFAAAPPQAGSFEIPAVIMSIMPAGAPVFPAIMEATKKLATKAVISIINYALTENGGRKVDSEMAFQLASESLREMGQTSRAAIDAIARVAESQRPAIRMFVSPIGETCSQARIGDTDKQNETVAVDQAMRAAIESPSPIEIGNETIYDVLITEIDVKNKSCKFSLRDDDDPDQRYNGEITDPILSTPNDPYSRALSEKRWILVKAKPQIAAGELERLYISDIAGTR